MARTKKTKTPLEMWENRFRVVFERKMRQRKPFTSDDIRRSVGLPPDKHPNYFGITFRKFLAANSYRLVVVGLTRSENKSARGRMLITYQANEVEDLILSGVVA